MKPTEARAGQPFREEASGLSQQLQAPEGPMTLSDEELTLYEKPRYPKGSRVIQRVGRR
jgi:hypothetical protein